MKTPSATFHSLSEALNHKNMNLQTALDALSEAHKKLQDFDKTKTEFISNVSHELRTPLSSIRSYSEILLNYDDIDPETQREFLQTINGESVRMSTFATEVLDLIRIGSGSWVLNFLQSFLGNCFPRAKGLSAPWLWNRGWN